MTDNCERLMLLRIWQLTGHQGNSIWITDNINLKVRTLWPDITVDVRHPLHGHLVHISFNKTTVFYSNTIDTLRRSLWVEFSSWLWKMCFETIRTTGTCTDIFGGQGLSSRPQILYTTPESRVTHCLYLWPSIYASISNISIFIIHMYLYNSLICGCYIPFWV